MHVLPEMLEAPDWAPHEESVLHQLDRKKRHNKSSKTRRKVLTGGSDEPIIIGLAIAVIIGIWIVCLMDALKNKLKGYVRNKYNKKD